MLKIKLNQLLVEKGKSPYWLAKRSKSRYDNILRLHKGKTKSINFDLLNRICEALDCQPGDIVEFVPAEMKAPVEKSAPTIEKPPAKLPVAAVETPDVRRRLEENLRRIRQQSKYSPSMPNRE